MGAFRDLTGRQFGRLAVVSRAPTNGRRDAYWNCICDCGTRVEVKAGSLTYGSSQSCGCLRLERAVATNTRHGQSSTKEYRAWQAMRGRCENRNNKKFAIYGGRGIAVCEAWKASFEAFFADVGPCPTPQHSLDRYPDNNGNYEPGNVRWATAQEQGVNRRATNTVLIGGRDFHVIEVCRLFRVEVFRVVRRLKQGLDAYQAFAVSPGAGGHMSNDVLFTRDEFNRTLGLVEENA